MSEFCVCLGNPGSGKSTLLNSFIGRVVFNSGFSAGSGMTFQFERYTSRGITYLDTPGLSDIEIREQAAREIEKALRSGDGHYRLVFVVTLESGRVRGDDLATIEVIMNALSSYDDLDVPYGVIINKVKPATIRRLEDGSEMMDQIRHSLKIDSHSRPPPTFLYPRKPELEDEANVLHTPSPSLVRFVNDIKPARLRPAAVDTIDTDRIDELLELLVILLLQHMELQGKADENAVRNREERQRRTDSDGECIIS